MSSERIEMLAEIINKIDEFSKTASLSRGDLYKLCLIANHSTSKALDHFRYYPLREDEFGEVRILLTQARSNLKTIVGVLP